MVNSNLRGTNPADGAASITPSDGADLAFVARALYVGGTGNIKIDTPNGDTVTFNAVPVGILPVRANKVYSTGTTATNIVALY
mgnify:FL=1|jgi:hypothetical protein